MKCPLCKENPKSVMRHLRGIHKLDMDQIIDLLFERIDNLCELLEIREK
jgi:hypothetical protein